MVAARVGADPAELLLGEVAALAAETDSFLHFGERGGERERFVTGTLQDVEREALGGARADPGQPGQLGDEVLDGRAEHERHCARPIRTGRFAACRGETSPVSDTVNEVATAAPSDAPRPRS